MIYVAEHHDALLPLWREQGLHGVSLAHVDFHDDLRGLLIDRARGRAVPLGGLARGGCAVDAGNFLAHAVVEGRLERIRWVHGLPGGRAWDVGIVRYSTDLLAWRYRLPLLLRRPPVYPLRFEELLLDEWGGLDAGERLSVDWDCFASIVMDEDGIAERVRAFLRRLGPATPPDTYLAYSPEYCRPTLERFQALARALGRRFTQPVRWLDPELPRGTLHPSGVRADLPRDALSRLVLWLRRRGVY